jgi:hypothetical protein
MRVQQSADGWEGISSRTVMTGLRPGTTPARGRASEDAADDGEEACIGVHYRLSAWRGFACWQPWQVHVGPQLQTSPHWHEPAGRAAGVWQPQLHSEPVQIAPAHAFD